MLQVLHGIVSLTGATSNKMKPETSITIKWSASKANSGTIAAYEVRYTTDDGITYKSVSTDIGASTYTYTFTPNVREGQILKVQVCAKNSYGKKSDYATFNAVTIYADGMSVGMINNNIKHLRAYVKVGGNMKKIKNIYVKINGRTYSIDQLPPPLN